MLQAASAAVPGSKFISDCKVIVDSIKLGRRAAVGGGSSHARIYALLCTAFDDTAADLLVWMPAHQGSAEDGGRCKSDGTALSKSILTPTAWQTGWRRRGLRITVCPIESEGSGSDAWRSRRREQVGSHRPRTKPIICRLFLSLTPSPPEKRQRRPGKKDVMASPTARSRSYLAGGRRLRMPALRRSGGISSSTPSGLARRRSHAPFAEPLRPRSGSLLQPDAPGLLLTDGPGKR